MSDHQDTHAPIVGGTQGLGCRNVVIAGRDIAKGEAVAQGRGATFRPVAAYMPGPSSGVMTGSVVGFDQHVAGAYPE